MAKTLTDSTDCVAIPLTRDEFAVVDKEDGYLADSKWCVTVSSDGKRKYAARSIRKLGDDGLFSVNSTVKMHRIIAASMGIDPLYRIRHKDGDGLNNRRNNIEVIQPANFNVNSTFENYVLSDRLRKGEGETMSKARIIDCVRGIISDGLIPTAELMATRLGFQCYSERPRLGVVRETLCFSELKDIFMMLPDELLDPAATVNADDV